MRGVSPGVADAFALPSTHLSPHCPGGAFLHDDESRWVLMRNNRTRRTFGVHAVDRGACGAVLDNNMVADGLCCLFVISYVSAYPAIVRQVPSWLRH